MPKLTLDRNFAYPDDIYEMIIGLVEECDMDTALLRTNKLALTLANHIGDADIIAEAINVAKSGS